MVIGVGSVYANSDIKKQFSLWADTKFTQTISSLNQDHSKAVDIKQESLIKNVNELKSKTLKELENSQTTIQNDVISDIQKELDSLETKLNESSKSKQKIASADFDSAVEEVNGKTKAVIQEVYEDPNLITKNTNQKQDPTSYDDAHKLVQEEIEKTKLTINHLKTLAEQSENIHVKKYLLDKATVLEFIIDNIEKK